MSGGLHAMITHPGEWQKLRQDPSLIARLVPEIIRWQTPVLRMRRTATRDTELGGKTIRKGDKVVMWYVSGNRDEEAIDQPDTFIIDPARRSARSPTSSTATRRCRCVSRRERGAGRAVQQTHRP